jgi:flavin reductase (DIM6/NTAB) family NADH-FMN oxidoreductase RutF
MSNFKEISPENLQANPFELIGKDWGLVTVDTKEKVNMMTVSWGGVGIMWNKPVAFTFIRPQRYTYSFLEEGEYFAISFLPDEYRNVLALCGKESGRDIDKVAKTGLTVVEGEKAPYFAQSKIVLICRKMYSQSLNAESVADKTALSCYNPDGSDYHKMYISEIEKVLIKE